MTKISSFYFRRVFVNEFPFARERHGKIKRARELRNDRKIRRRDVDKISSPRWSVNSSIDIKARIKRRRLFHPRAEINFAHLAGCQLPSTDWAHFNEKRYVPFYVPSRQINGNEGRAPFSHLLLRFLTRQWSRTHPPVYISLTLSNNFQRLSRKVVCRDARINASFLVGSENECRNDIMVTRFLFQYFTFDCNDLGY